MSLNILQRPSASFGDRRGGVVKASIVVIHYTAMESAEQACVRLCDPGIEVSSHYLIDEGGLIIQMVAEDKRAWHAGAGSWRDITDVNSCSIGIELANVGNAIFPEPQILALIELVADISNRLGILPMNVIGHSDLAPGRKVDPGPWFDWRRFEDMGLAMPITLRFDQILDMPNGKVNPDNFMKLAYECGYTAQASLQDIVLSLRLRVGRQPLVASSCDLVDFAALENIHKQLVAIDAVCKTE